MPISRIFGGGGKEVKGTGTIRCSTTSIIVPESPEAPLPTVKQLTSTGQRRQVCSNSYVYQNVATNQLRGGGFH